MRLLALYRDIPPGFSTGGSLEVVAYGAIVGSVTGLFLAIAMTTVSMPIRYSGPLVALLSYAGTIATLPRHIAATVQPFAGDMAIVLSLFSVCFLIFGYVLALVLARCRHNVQH